MAQGNGDTSSECSVISNSDAKTVSRSLSSVSSREDKWPDLLLSKPAGYFFKTSSDPVVIERSNLVNISKLIVKELIEQSLRFGRMLDTDHMPLRHFFIVLEHVLRHGLKPKKGLLGPKKELWDLLQTVEKFAPEAQDITASVRDLPTVNTVMGRARAWLRLALMQKRLADYLRCLLEHREDTLDEYYEPHALMLNDEAIVITGLLVGLNVVDCNLCVKEEDLDSQQGVIDFSLYLRGTGNSLGIGNALACDADAPEPRQRHINTMLDQKNYIEELNRHLNATIANLQTKVETLTTTNALMKEDLAISKNNMLQLIEENNQLKHALGQNITHRDVRQRIPEVSSLEEEDESDSKFDSKLKASKTNEDLLKLLDDERNKNNEVQKELDLQMCLKAEMEVAMKLLEKDIHDKQDTIISLRRQLDDIKLINLEMYKKLQERESSLEHKKEMILKLEGKTDLMGNTIQQLDEKLRETRLSVAEFEETCRVATQSAEEAIDQVKLIQNELHVEKEWRVNLQETMIKDRDKISQLNLEIDSMRQIERNYLRLQDDHQSLTTQWTEAQKTMEELGATLSENKLQLVELLEARGVSVGTGAWADDKEVVACKGCGKEFNLTRRKHHCRRCGNIFCAACSERSAALPSGSNGNNNSRPVRVCDDCHIHLSSR